jgi:transposase-like protein
VKRSITDKIYNDDDAARTHLESVLWPQGPFCPHCGSFAATKLEGKAHRKGLYQCNDCRDQYSVTVGTVFERSKIPLHKWVLAAHMMESGKKGKSAKELQRQLGVTYKTAWFMAMRLREASRELDATPLGGEGKALEADETFVGGRKKNVHRGKPAPRKHAVHALVEPGDHLRATHVPDVSAKTLREVLAKHADPKSALHTDDALTNLSLGKDFADHKTVVHSAGEYFKDGAGVQSAESFFSLLKRGVYGAFHSVSEQHLQRYCDEIAFRFNRRQSLGFDDFQRTDALLRAARGKRLTYRRPDAASKPSEG